MGEVDSKIECIREKHRTCVADILAKSPASAERILQLIESDIKDILDLLRAVQLMKMAHEQILVKRIIAMG